MGYMRILLDETKSHIFVYLLKGDYRLQRTWRVCVNVTMTIIRPPPELVLRSGLVKGGGGFVIMNDVGGGGYWSV